ncbi:unnamed protein product [Camellia sinensis]
MSFLHVIGFGLKVGYLLLMLCCWLFSVISMNWFINGGIMETKTGFLGDGTKIWVKFWEMISEITTDQDSNAHMVYWLSNTFVLLFLLQRTLKATGGKPPTPTSFFGRMTQGFRSSLSSTNLSFCELEVYQVEAKYPALLFKQQLATYVEKIYGIVRDNSKKDSSSLLSSCIQAKGNLLKMNNFNLLSKILDDNRLTGSNYVDWKRNLTIVLTAEKLNHVLTTDPPALPEADATNEQREAVRKWHEADDVAKCYILASMTNVLQKQHEGVPTTKDMMVNLKEMFGEQSRSARQTAMKGLIY